MAFCWLGSGGSLEKRQPNGLGASAKRWRLCFAQSHEPGGYPLRLLWHGCSTPFFFSVLSPTEWSVCWALLLLVLPPALQAFPPVPLHSPHPHSMPWFYCILIPLFTGSILSTYKHSELWNLYTTPLPLQSPPSFPPWISPRRQTEGLPHCLWPTVHWPPPVPLKQYPLTAPPHDQYTHKHSWAPEVSTDQL